METHEVANEAGHMNDKKINEEEDPMDHSSPDATATALKAPEVGNKQPKLQLLF